MNDFSSSNDKWQMANDLIMMYIMGFLFLAQNYSIDIRNNIQNLVKIEVLNDVFFRRRRRRFVKYNSHGSRDLRLPEQSVSRHPEVVQNLFRHAAISGTF